MRKMLLGTMLLMNSPAWAASAGDLLAACNGAPGTEATRLCAAYINGFVNGVLGDQVAREQGTPICIPDHTTTLQVRDVVKEFLGKLPLAVLEVDEGGIVAGVLAKAYPCPKN